MAEQRRVMHLKQAGGTQPKCGATDAWSLTNWVRGASYNEVYVPTEVVSKADVVCDRCQDEALRDDGGSDDEVVPEGEEERPEQAEEPMDPAFAEVTDERLIHELERRLAGIDRLAQEDRDQARDRHN
ncbi:MAG TPA: hypothetical protein VGR87_14615 [Candidatus Limnocylindria bacterium]|jgi:hypothetical protein|nr:hypothetical protein [Candidatus Limnocylindria bacterium]